MTDIDNLADRPENAVPGGPHARATAPEAA